MRVLVVAHDHVSPTGFLGERFEERGYDLVRHDVVSSDRFHSPGVEPRFPSFTDFEAVVAMGAPWSAYEDAVGSWVTSEVDELRRADAAGVPVLGICFGGQLLAQAHGGDVWLSSRPEIGWVTVRSAAPHIVPEGPWFQWHYDAWTVPTDAREIARNEAASQAFVLRRNLAVQFHPELNGAMLAGWLGNGGADKATAFGLDPKQLLVDTEAADERSRARAHALVDGFLDHVAGGDVATDRRLA